MIILINIVFSSRISYFTVVSLVDSLVILGFLHVAINKRKVRYVLGQPDVILQCWISLFTVSSLHNTTDGLKDSKMASPFHQGHHFQVIYIYTGQLIYRSRVPDTGARSQKVQRHFLCIFITNNFSYPQCSNWELTGNVLMSLLLS